MLASKIIRKNEMIIKYFFCSALCSVIDFLVLFILKHFDMQIVVANTLAIVTSSIIHYIITSKFVFKVKKDLSSATIYIITFFVGLVIQDGVIYLLYEKILPSSIENNSLLTFVCKLLSLAVSFLVTFSTRKVLNEKFGAKEQ